MMGSFLKVSIFVTCWRQCMHSWLWLRFVQSHRCGILRSRTACTHSLGFVRPILYLWDREPGFVRRILLLSDVAPGFVSLISRSLDDRGWVRFVDFAFVVLGSASDFRPFFRLFCAPRTPPGLPGILEYRNFRGLWVARIPKIPEMQIVFPEFDGAHAAPRRSMPPYTTSRKPARTLASIEIGILIRSRACPWTGSSCIICLTFSTLRSTR
jgi:hypothetical protein